MSGFGTNGQNGSAFGTNTGSSLFGSGGTTPTNNASQSSSTTPTPNASGAVGFAAAWRPETVQYTPSPFGSAFGSTTATSTGTSLFGPAPVSSATAPAAASITRASVFGAGASTTTTLPTSGGLFGSRPVSTTASPVATGSGLFGSAPSQGGFGGVTTTTSSSAPGSGLFGSAPAAAAPTSTGSGLFGTGAVSTPATSTTAAGLFGTTSTAGTGASTAGASLFGNLQTLPTEASTSGEAISNPSSSSSAPTQSETTTTQPTPTRDLSGNTLPAMATASNGSDPTGTNETENSALPQRNVINIDPDGDLLLDVGGDEASESSQPQRLRVCSSALRRHSPVWKQMLFGPWKESKPANVESEEWIVELPDDPVKPMQIVLNIIHGRFNQVPRSLSLDELYKLLILTNKYDMTDILRPWCAQWTAVARGDLSSADTLKSLFIAWELGDQDLFALRVEEISVNTSSKEKSLFSQVETRFSKKSVLAGNPEWIDLEGQDYLGPQDILDVLRSIRKEVLSMIIAAVNNDMAVRKIPSLRTVCSGPQVYKSGPYRMMSISEMGSAALCDAAILGGLAIHIDHRLTSSIALPPTTETIVQVASGVFPKIKLIEILPHHQQCSLRAKYETLDKKIHEELPGLVARHIKPAHKKYMESQRNKTGIELSSQVGEKQRQASTRRYW